MGRTLVVTSLIALLGVQVWAEKPAKKAEPALSPDAQAALADVEKTLGFTPAFMKQMPMIALPGLWDTFKSLVGNPNTALPPKMKELIGLAVASQIPCKYCVYAHTKFAKFDGASDAELGEAVTLSALTRNFSTFMNGIQLDEAKFRQEITQLTQNIKKAQAAKTPPPAPGPITDGASALKEATAMFGFTPEFLKRYPEGPRAGAWRLMRDVQMNPSTALPGKYKSLVGLAVAAQVPCRYCVIADTEFAKLEGATEAEIGETLAMAGLVRAFSTMLNGLQMDEATFRKDIDRLTKPVAKKQAMAGGEKGM